MPTMINDRYERERTHAKDVAIYSLSDLENTKTELKNLLDREDWYIAKHIGRLAENYEKSYNAYERNSEIVRMLDWMVER